MKRILRLLSFILIFTLIFFSFNCGEAKNAKASIVLQRESQIVVKIENTDNDVSLFEVLLTLQNESLIDIEYSQGPYGAYLTAVNGKSEMIIESTMVSSRGYSWLIYSTDRDTTFEEESITVDNKRYFQSAYGISSLKVKKGESYLLSLEYYEYSW